jgi:MscS family membrane protein
MEERATLDDWKKQMLFRTKSRRRIGLLTRQACSLGLTALVLLLINLAIPSASAQHLSPAPPKPKPEPTAPVDPLGRESPRGTVMGLLTYSQRGDYATATRYLQLRPGQHIDMVQLSKEFRVLYPDFKGSLNLLSDDPNWEGDTGLPPGQVRAGVIKAGDSTADVILVRVDDPVSGKIWLVSQSTVASIPKLFAQVRREAPTRVDQYRTALLSGPVLLGMSSKQWLGWLLSIPLSWLLAWLLTFVLSMPKRIWCKVRKVPFRSVWDTPLGMPLRCMIAILLHGSCVYLLQPPLLYRVYYVRFIAVLLAACFAWLASRVSDQGFNLALHRTRTHGGGGESILLLMQKLNHVGIVIVTLAVALALLGMNVSATLTGLGIGGLAVALAAQKTLENLIGGVSLLMDRALQVGDFCKIGDRMGTVEDIGLRSVKLRTLDQNLLVIPNGSLAQMQFENMRSRAKLLIDQNFTLRIETQVEQLKFILDSAQKMLDEHPMIESETSRLRVINFAGAAYELHLFAYGKTSDMKEFTAVRQDVLFKLVGIVEAAGTRFAAPTRLTYLHTDPSVEVERANNVARHEIEPVAGKAFQFPDEVQTGTK